MSDALTIAFGLLLLVLLAGWLVVGRFLGFPPDLDAKIKELKKELEDEERDL
jgi:hypothetical protein